MTLGEGATSRDGETPDRPGLASLRTAVLYSEEVGIGLAAGNDRELFKWFLASTLYGARISETIARATYRAFERHRLLDPRAILRAGRDFLIGTVMAEGGYVRYDHQRSDQLLRNATTLLDEYGGSLKRLHRRASDAQDLEGRLQRFHGVGPVTANIFLRELRPVWAKADPEPLPVVVESAGCLGVNLAALDRKSWEFCRVEAGLIRWRHGGRRRRRTGGGRGDGGPGGGSDNFAGGSGEAV
ncbi:MAG: hypothetical protein JSU98_11945 [Gemmatimonadales bacterium]|nr:MAG: hypothetical protein JSU98_11945 [Gemmatimonadales bacterium]